MSLWQSACASKRSPRESVAAPERADRGPAGWLRAPQNCRSPRHGMTAPKPIAALEEGLRQAHAALRAGRAATAERLLRALQAQFPGEVNILWLLGAARLAQDKVSA